MTKARNRGKRVAPPADTLEVAISLAKAGWPVFPVSVYEDEAGRRHKIPAVKWKTWATTDVEKVRAAWSGEHAKRWIGVYAEGAGIVTLDLDLAKGEKPSGAESLQRAELEIPETPIHYLTPSGGRHHVYAAPKGVDLTIAQDLRIDGVKLEGVDVRSGAGLMLYYGPPLKKKDVAALPPAPDWLLVSRKREGATSGGDYGDRDPSATEVAFVSRLVPGKPPKKLRKTIESVDFPAGAAHEPMLEAVAALVSAGASGTPGVGKLIRKTRERYVGDHPDRGRDWDNAIAGSVKRFGLPLRSFPIDKSAKKAIAARTTDEAVEAQKRARRAYLIAEHIENGDDLTDDALAEHIAKRYGDTWANVTGVGLVRYDGRTWRPKDRAVLIDDVRILLREIRAIVTYRAIRSGDAQREKAANALGSRGKIVAVADLAAGMMLAHEPKLDAHPDLLNAANGVVDLRTGELSPHDASLYFTRCAPCDYDPTADATQWRRALEALQPKVSTWLQVRFGQAITGYRPDDDVLVFLQGVGSNGKSTILDAARNALGESSDGGYSATVSDQLLLASPDAHPTTLMSLMGVRFAVFEELPEGHALNVKRLKDTVGTPKITARKMRQDEITFRATHALFGSTNPIPLVAETDHGTWRRLALCHFPYRYVPEDEIASTFDRPVDESIVQHFAEPDPAVLAWLVDGARQWYAAGRKLRKAAPMPKHVVKSTRAWRMDADPVIAYLDERIVRAAGFAITTKDLADDFNAWNTSRGHKEWSQTTVNARFGGHSSFEGVTRQRVRFGLATRPSRPPMTFGQKPIPANTQAWLGVRFVGDDESAERADFDDLAERIQR